MEFNRAIAVHVGRNLLLTLFVFFSSNAILAQTRIICIGNSITYGARLPDREKQSYPAQLQQMLGDKYEVLNFGVSSSTLLSRGNKPYIKTAAFQQALASQPDIVIIKLGGNDSKLINRIYLAEFKEDYQRMIDTFRNLASHPRIILMTPLKFFTTDTTGIWDQPVEKIMIPALQAIAFERDLELINFRTLFLDKEHMMPDKVHPDEHGAMAIAKRLKEQVTLVGKPFNIATKIKERNTEKSFYGYRDHQFKFKGREAHVVKPKVAAKGNPWVWRSRFWSHQPQTDIALLERGYHIVYCDVVELYGNKEAIQLWDDFYKYLRKIGLAKKAVMEGMSRGGVYIYAWAAKNPRKIACVYTDNAVMDLKSWPGGFRKSNGSKKDWEIYKKDFGYSNDEEAKSAKDSPIDKIKQIVKGKYPMLHVCADKDEAAPIEENTAVFEKLIKAAGGNITVIHKPEAKHHPHSLPNPQPIVDFILAAPK